MHGQDWSSVILWRIPSLVSHSWACDLCKTTLILKSIDPGADWGKVKTKHDPCSSSVPISCNFEKNKWRKDNDMTVNPISLLCCLSRKGAFPLAQRNHIPHYLVILPRDGHSGKGFSVLPELVALLCLIKPELAIQCLLVKTVKSPLKVTPALK